MVLLLLLLLSQRAVLGSTLETGLVRSATAGRVAVLVVGDRLAPRPAVITVSL